MEGTNHGQLNPVSDHKLSEAASVPASYQRRGKRSK